MNKNGGFVFFAFVLLWFCSPAYAHKVSVFAYAEDGTVYTESYFVDGKPCVSSKISVEDPEGRVLVEGETDGEGMFSFEVPAAADLKIVLHASMGHRAEYVVKAEELGGGGKGESGASPAGWRAGVSAARVALGIFGVGVVMGLWLVILRVRRSGGA